MMRQARLSPTSKRAACPSTSVAMVLADITHGFIDVRVEILDCGPANLAGLGGRPEGWAGPRVLGREGLRCDRASGPPRTPPRRAPTPARRGHRRRAHARGA